MPRRQSILTGLALSVLLTVGLWFALPLLIAGYLESRFAGLGFADAAVIAGYPSWGGLRLDELRLVRRYGSGTLSIRALDLSVNYRPMVLWSGHIDSVRIARVEVERVPAPDAAVLEATQADSGPAIVTPGRWLAGLPMEELTVDALQVIWREGDAVHGLSAAGFLRDGEASLTGWIHPADGEALELSASLSEGGELHLAIRLPGNRSATVLVLDNRISQSTGGTMRIEGSLQARWAPLATLFGAWLGGGGRPGKLDGNLASRWQGVLPASPDAAERIRIDSEHHLDLQAERLGTVLEQARARLDVNSSLTGRRLDWRIGSRSGLSARLSNKGPDARGETPLDIGFPQGAAGTSEQVADGVTVTVLPGFPVRVSALQRDGLSLAEARIELADAATLHYVARSARWSASPLRLVTPGLGLRWPEGEAQAKAVLFKVDALDIGAEGLKGSGDVRIEGIQPVIRGRPLPAASLEAPFRLDGNRVDAEARLVAGQGKLVLSAQGRHHVASGQGQVRFALAPVMFGEPGNKLSHLLEPWRLPLELRAGRIAADGRFDWRGLAATQGFVLDGEFRLHGDGLAGHYGAIGFAGLSTDLALSGRDGLRTSEPARVRIGSLVMGFPLTDLQMVTDLNVPLGGKPPAGELRQFSVGLLGGKAHAEAVQWDLAAAAHRVTLILQGVSLAEIVALENRDDVQAKGTLDGRLPLEISTAGIALRGGELHARPPGGVIRYRPAAGAQSLANDHPSMNILVQALANLKYEVLKVNADSSPEGDLTLKVALQGRNPDWQSGRPIHLNLRLQENIPKLLRSLQLADDISQRVQDRFRNKP